MKETLCCICFAPEQAYGSAQLLEVFDRLESDYKIVWYNHYKSDEEVRDVGNHL